MWQEIIVYITGILVVFYIGIKIYRFFCNTKKGMSHCDSCSGCVLKEVKKKNNQI
jgi:hypothetical protein